MSAYKREFFDQYHEKLDMDCGLKYIVHKFERPVLEFKGHDLSCMVSYNPDLAIFTVNGKFHEISNTTMSYWAANPIHRIYSYSGSGLPYANPEMAYENTPNQGDVIIDNEGKFIIRLDHPSAYYVRQGSTLLKPHVHLRANGLRKIFTVQLADILPYRSLTGLPDRPNRTQPGPLGGTGGRTK